MSPAVPPFPSPGTPGEGREGAAGENPKPEIRNSKSEPNPKPEIRGKQITNNQYQITRDQSATPNASSALPASHGSVISLRPDDAHLRTSNASALRPSPGARWKVPGQLLFARLSPHRAAHPLHH